MYGDQGNENVEKRPHNLYKKNQLQLSFFELLMMFVQFCLLTAHVPGVRCGLGWSLFTAQVPRVRCGLGWSLFTAHVSRVRCGLGWSLFTAHLDLINNIFHF